MAHRAAIFFDELDVLLAVQRIVSHLHQVLRERVPKPFEIAQIDISVIGVRERFVGEQVVCGQFNHGRVGARVYAELTVAGDRIWTGFTRLNGI